MVIVVTPFYRVLRMTDCEGSTLGLLTHFFRAAVEEVKACTSIIEDQRMQILTIAEKRWKWMHKPIHGFAALLHPAYKSLATCNDRELLFDRLEYMVHNVPVDSHNALLEEMGCYVDQRGHVAFASPTCWRRESLVKPLFWWENFGYALETLQPYALRVLAQDCSSGACERNWSAYSLIHTKIRNKLSTRQLERLIYCRTNLRMMRAILSMGSPKQVMLSPLLFSKIIIYS